MPATIRDDIKKRADELIAEKRWTNQQIERLLGEEFGDSAPSLSWLQHRRPKDGSALWSLADGRGDESDRLILETKRVVLEKTEGRESVSIAEAQWIARVRSAAPSMEPYTAFTVARLYLMREGRGEDMHDLDVMLAYRPWKSVEDALEWVRAVESGVVPWPRAYTATDETAAAISEEGE
ncbi:MAG: hypothetical protein R3C39_00230 [Dehalococcoidia bacterium]